MCIYILSEVWTCSFRMILYIHKCSVDPYMSVYIIRYIMHIFVHKSKKQKHQKDVQSPTGQGLFLLLPPSSSARLTQACQLAGSLGPRPRISDKMVCINQSKQHKCGWFFKATVNLGALLENEWNIWSQFQTRESTGPVLRKWGLSLGGSFLCTFVSLKSGDCTLFGTETADICNAQNSQIHWLIVGSLVAPWCRSCFLNVLFMDGQ